MTAEDALLFFLRRALGEKRERLCGFASRPKARHKFFDTLYHGFYAYVSSSVVRERLPEVAWSSPSYGFVTPDRFGVPFESLRKAYEARPLNEGALYVTEDGEYGVWCDHTYGDVQAFYAVRRER